MARPIALIAAFGIVGSLIAMFLALTESSPDGATAGVLLVMAAFCAMPLLLLRRGAVSAAGWVLFLSVAVAATILVFTGDSRGFGDIAMMFYPLLVIAASFLLGQRGFVPGVVVIIVMICLILLFELSGLPASDESRSEKVADFGFSVLIVVVCAVTTHMLANSLRLTIDHLRESERTLAAHVEELERFTYTVSHDLKSPLVTMGGFLGFVRTHAERGDLDSFRRDMERVEVAKDQMTQLLEELLHFSRVGHVPRVDEEIPFGEILREAEERVSGKAQSAGARIVVDGQLPRVLGDRLKLVELMQNLLENSLTYVSLHEAPVIRVGAREQGGVRVFYVRDNGIGIEQAYHEKIFELFESLDPRNRGSGVGLAIVKRVVEVHGGRIWVESEGRDRGATFCFTLPSATDEWQTNSESFEIGGSDPSP